MRRWPNCGRPRTAGYVRERDRVNARRLDKARARHRLRAWLTVALGLVLFAASATEANAQQFAGVNDHLLWSTFFSPNDHHPNPDFYLRLQDAANLGAKMVRVDLRWDKLESLAQGTYDPTYLAEIDQVVSETNSLGMKPLFVVLGTPCWASSAPPNVTMGCVPTQGWDAYPPSNPGYYAQAMGFLAARYGSQVAGWEIWNEPNLSYFWNSSNPASDYVWLIKAAYPAIKKVSSVPVIGGAVSLSDANFVSQLYADGIEGNFDVLSIHPYSFNDSPLTSGINSYYSSPLSSFVDGVPAVHNVMAQNGDPRAMWLTEFGWPTWTAGVSPATQATYVRQAYTRMQAWPYVQGGFYYELEDEGTDSSNSEQNYGLYYFDGSPKPAAGAFEAAATAFSQQAYSPPPGASTAAPQAQGGASGTAPDVTAFAQSARRWVETKRALRIARKKAKLPVGTTFSFNLNAPASVTLAFRQKVGGRMVGKRCVAQTRRNRGKRRCRRTVTVATLNFSAHLAANKVRFFGRIPKHRKLRPGRYTVVITATNAAGKSRPRSLTFTIVR